MERSLFKRIVNFVEPFVPATATQRDNRIGGILHGSPVLKKIKWDIGASEDFAKHLIRTVDIHSDDEMCYLLRELAGPGVNQQEKADQLCKEIRRSATAPPSDLEVGERDVESDSIAEDRPSLTTGAIIDGRWELIQQIGDTSGQATVWQVKDSTAPELQSRVIKCVKPHPTRAYDKRYKEEIYSVWELEEHPHIINIYDFGDDRGLLYMVMPMLSESLKARTERNPPLNTDKIMKYLRQIADGLDAAHAKGIVHRDLKPANILFKRERDEVCIADFGIAYRKQRQGTITGSSETAATREYAAPEQLKDGGEPVPQTDIYALAIIAYELLTGERPYRGSKDEIAAAHLSKATQLTENDALSAPVLEALHIGTAYEPHDRPTTASAFVEMLADAIAGKAPHRTLIETYLDETLPEHLEEEGRESFGIANLELTFGERDANLREEITQRPKRKGLPGRKHRKKLVSKRFKPEPKSTRPAPKVEVAGEVRYPDNVTQSEVEHVQNVRDRLRTLQRAVLLGPPGAGKTFMLARLALDYASAHRENTAAPIPVFVPLAKYNGKTDFASYIERRCGAIMQQPNLIYLLDALNEMPEESGQWAQLQTFITEQLVARDNSFVISCRIRDYENKRLSDIKQLYRVELQDLNPQQIYDILVYYFDDDFTARLWNDLFDASGLLDAWQAWDGAVRDFWQRPKGYISSREIHKKVRARIHDDPRKLLLLCRSPFTLVQLIIPRIDAALDTAEHDSRPIMTILADWLPNNRADLFKSVIEDMLTAEAEKEKNQWDTDTKIHIRNTLEFTAAAMQAREQRTKIELESLRQTNDVPDNLDRLLRMGRDAGLVTLTDSEVRFNHQLFQEYFATKRLRDLLDDYNARHPAWESAEPLPPRDERLAELFPDWWKAGGWRVSVSLLGELEGRTGIGRVVRWLASYAPEIALNCVLDNNDNLALEDIPENAHEALIAGAHSRTDEPDPHGRAAAYRVLGTFKRGDQRQGIGTIPPLWIPLKEGLIRLPDIEWVTIPAGEFTYQDTTMTLDYDFKIARYPVTYMQFQTFLDDSQGAAADRWWQGLPEESNPTLGSAYPTRQIAEQRFQYWNHPRETVNWYQMIAFCRWLSWRMGGGYDLDDIATWAVRLPTEYEWEKAARAATGWEYPYGDAFDTEKGNTSETGLSQTSAVGIFPNGDTPHWQKPISDLSGNVWEWCLTDHTNSQPDATQENMRSTAVRVLRGGGWGNGHGLARAVTRYDLQPDYRFNNFGLRLCVPLL